MAGDPEENNKAKEEHLDNMQKVHERQYPLPYTTYNVTYDI